MKKSKFVRFSKTPPPGWPSEEQFAEVEKIILKREPPPSLPKNATAVQILKHDLCGHFVQYFNEHNFSQREIAKKLGVGESRVSEILHFHHERYTIDKLLELLTRLKPEIRIKVA